MNLKSKAEKQYRSGFSALFYVTQKEGEA